ncbi:hypothetical protein DICVIV_06131 [Dictyocaulus viviparus]|uniref:Uncharacterized protein n=1 Tax=Dictyocaulus viviparus TaxID=29172 RepID=A0A0D8XT42_DICVI|nr:hypothetical protein DICVIV_06131 [Dictyocaulus viviparus]
MSGSYQIRSNLVQPFTSDFSQLQSIGGKYWEEGEIVADPHGIEYCIPGGNSLAPLLFSVLSEEVYNDTIEFEEGEPYKSTSWLYELMLKFYENLHNYDAPSAWDPFRNFSKYIAEPHRPIKSNKFVLATHDEAYAYIGSIGSAFGSLYLVPFMNNLMSGIVENFYTDKGFTNSLTPFIAFENDEVLIAYSGSPGFTSMSLGIPRMLHALIMYNVHGEILEKSVITPLVFPNPVEHEVIYSYYYPRVGNGRVYRNGINVKLQKLDLTRNHKEMVMDTPSFYMDSVAAISRRYAGNRSVLVPFYKTKKSETSNQISTYIVGV